MKQTHLLAGLLFVAAACKTGGSAAKLRSDGDEAAPAEPAEGETAEAAPLSPNPFTAMDVAVLFPARDKADISNLLKLDAAPAAGNGFAGRGDGPIIDRATFDGFVARAKDQGKKIAAVPPYERWRIVGVRPLFCARVKNAEDQAKKGAYPNACQVEHRLVAQPLNDAGTGFLDFSLHIISRPFQPGAPQNLELAQHIASNLSQIKAKAGVNDSNGKGFAAYPALAARDAMVSTLLKDHIKRFYGGEFLRTLAFMGSNGTAQKDATNWLFFSGPSGANQLSMLIRPGSTRFDPHPTTFETVDQSTGTAFLNFFNGRGESQTADGQPTRDATSGAKKPFPNLSAIFAGQTDAAAVQQAATIENIKTTVLSDTDCASCHHVTAAVGTLGLRAKVNADAAAFPFQNQQPVAPGTLQSRKEMFINLGYFTPAGGQTLFSVSQELINDATQQAIFVNNLSKLLILPNVELLSQTAQAPTAAQMVPVGAPDFEPVADQL